MSCQGCGCDPEAKWRCSRHALLFQLQELRTTWAALREQAGLSESTGMLDYCIRSLDDLIHEHRQR